MKDEKTMIFEKMQEILKPDNGFSFSFVAKNGDRIALKSWYADESGVFVNGKMVFHADYNGNIMVCTPGDWVNEVLAL